MDIWNNADPTTFVRTFDAGGTLVDTFTLANTVGQKTSLDLFLVWL